MVNARLAVTVGALVGLALGALAGCDPRAFDELADDTWVRSSEPPEGLSTQAYAVALAGPDQRPARGAYLFAVARNQDGFAHLTYGEDGALSAAALLTGDLAIEALQGIPPRPVLAGDSDSARVAVALRSGVPASRAHVLLLDAETGSPEPPIDLEGGELITALDFDGGDGADPMTLAHGDLLVRIPDLATPAGARPSCRLPRGPAGSLVVADFDAGTPGSEILVALSADETNASAFLLLPGDVIEAAADTADPDGPAADCLGVGRQPLRTLEAPEREPDFGQIAASADFDGDGTLDLAASVPSREVVHVFLDVAAGGDPIELRAPSDAIGFGSALAAGDLDGQGGAELVVGAPESNREDASAAGSAHLYRFADGAFGEAAVLADAEPEDDQHFGQSMAAVPFGPDARSMLVIGSTREVFAYFRTPVSDDLRP